MPISDARIGLLNHSKGMVSGTMYRYASWDFVKPCTGEDCTLYKYCVYWNDGNNKKLSKCKVEGTYIRNQLSIFIPIMERYPDPFIIQSIGDHIIPLYHDLCKVQMEIAGWEHDIMYTDRTGKRLVLPLYREKREIQTTIWKIMKDSGITAYLRALGYFIPKVNSELQGINSQPVLNNDLGDGVYIDQMYSSEETK